MTQQAIVTHINDLTGVATCCIMNTYTGVPRTYKVTQARDLLREGDKIEIFTVSTNWANLIGVVDATR